MELKKVLGMYLVFSALFDKGEDARKEGEASKRDAQKAAQAADDKKSFGQALTEFALVVPIFLMIVLFLLDPAIATFNHAIAKYVTFKAAREASIFLAGSAGDTCYQEAIEAAYGNFGVPPLLMVDLNDSSAWNMQIDPCPDDPSWSPTSGSFVTATLTWNQDRIFAFDFTGQQEVMEDVFQ